MSRAISRVIQQYHSFLITTHIDPDLDALCSQLALARYLLSLGKRVQMINANVFPERYDFLVGSKKIRSPDQRIAKHDVVIIVDCGDINRIGRVQDYLSKQAVVINIDHHITNTFFGDVNLVKSRSSSTAEVIFDFLKSLKVPIDRVMAELLYYGIITDTGSFRYNNTTGHTHRVAASLVDLGLPVYQIYQRVYARFLAKDLKFFLRLSSDFKSFCQGQIIYFCLKKEVIKKIDDRFDVRENLFTLFRSMPHVRVIVIFTEVSEKLTKVNFRSTGHVDVAKIAVAFKGGGHQAASGCRIPNDLKRSQLKVLSVIKAHL
jgi:bifunctional oligoribonuclease and PAP phosphatase NrnA